MGIFLLLAPRGALANEPPTRALPRAAPVPRERGVGAAGEEDGWQPRRWAALLLRLCYTSLNIDQPIGEDADGPQSRC